MRALLIPSNPNTPATGIEIEPELRAIQAAVGGDIQAIGIRGHQVNTYLCEDGKLLGMPANSRATLVGLATGSIFAHDVIVGNVLFTGPVDEMGNDPDLPEHEMKWLLALIAEPRPAETSTQP